MKRFLFSAVTLAVGLLSASSNEVLAGHGGSGHGGHGSMSRSHESHNSHRNSYYKNHGKKFSHGYFYHGRDHRHWSYRGWSKRYGCYCYWDSGCRCWYYWSEPKCCYYPISYATVCTPTVVTTHQDAAQSRFTKVLDGGRNQLFGNLAYQRTTTDSSSVFGFVDSTRVSGLDTTINWSHRLSQFRTLRLRYQFTRLTTDLINRTLPAVASGPFALRRAA